MIDAAAIDPRAHAAADDAAPIREIVRRIEPRVEELAQKMVARYTDEITDYRLRLPEDEILASDVLEVTIDNVRVLLQSLAAGTQVGDEQLERTRASAAMRVHQHISLEAFLHATRLWGQVVWETVLETAHVDRPDEREAALHIAGHVLRHMDLMSTAVAQSYVNEIQGLWSAREVVRRDLLDALISGKGDTQRIRRLARSLGHALCDTYVVALARGADGAMEETLEQAVTARGPLRRIVEATRAHLHPAAGSVLVGMRHGEVVALYPVSDASEMDRVREDCDALARDLADDSVRVGVSGCHVGLGSVPDNYCEASDALEIAAGAGILGRAIVFDDVLIDHVARSSAHGDRILDGTLRPLLKYDAERQSELVPTLRAYVESGFNLTRSAETLMVHPNTVQYRLRRIKELAGRDPFDPEDLLLLFLGLKLTELSPGGNAAAADAAARRCP